MADLLRPLSDQIQEVQNFREKNRGSSLFNHLSAVSESIPALGWVTVVSTSLCLTLPVDTGAVNNFFYTHTGADFVFWGP